jgi:chromosomal replication initiation ATPase DnaA
MVSEARPPIPTGQLRLQLPPSIREEDTPFVVSASNSDAVAALDAWTSWPDGRLVLIGPEGVGKSHLARAWARRVGAREIRGHRADSAAWAGGPVFLENADRGVDEETLFHALNLADRGGGVLLTARTDPREWRVGLPDLRSRLNSLLVAKIEPPDDAVLRAVLVGLFRERNIKAGEEVLNFLIRRMERSVPAARDIVNRIDEFAAAERREITRLLVRQILDGLPPEADPVE